MWKELKMPTYNYKCKKCDSFYEAFKKISERYETSDMVCRNCGTVGNSEYIISCPTIVSDVGSLGPLGKTDNGWKEVLSKVRSTHTINNIKT